MQLGASKKLITLLESLSEEEVIIAVMQPELRWVTEQCSVLGLLVKSVTLEEQWKLSWHALTYSIEGSEFYMPEKYWKGFKFKKSQEEVATLFEKVILNYKSFSVEKHKIFTKKQVLLRYIKMYYKYL